MNFVLTYVLAEVLSRTLAIRHVNVGHTNRKQNGHVQYEIPIDYPSGIWMDMEHAVTLPKELPPGGPKKQSNSNQAQNEFPHSGPKKDTITMQHKQAGPKTTSRKESPVSQKSHKFSKPNAHTASHPSQKDRGKSTAAVINIPDGSFYAFGQSGVNNVAAKSMGHKLTAGVKSVGSQSSVSISHKPMLKVEPHIVKYDVKRHQPIKTNEHDVGQHQLTDVNQHQAIEVNQHDVDRHKYFDIDQPLSSAERPAPAHAEEVVESLTTQIGNKFIECENIYHYPLSVRVVFLNYWLGEELRDLRAGCACACIIQRLQLFDDSGVLKEVAALEFLDANDADDKTKRHLVYLGLTCTQLIDKLDLKKDICKAALMFMVCFRDGIFYLGWNVPAEQRYEVNYKTLFRRSHDALIRRFNDPNAGHFDTEHALFSNQTVRKLDDEGENQLETIRSKVKDAALQRRLLTDNEESIIKERNIKDVALERKALVNTKESGRRMMKEIELFTASSIVSTSGPYVATTTKRSVLNFTGL